MAAVAAACGDDRVDDAGPSTTAIVEVPEEASSLPVAPVTPAAPQPTAPPAPPAPPAAPPETAPATTVATAIEPPVPEPAPPAVGGVGSLAATYLRPAASPAVLVEVRHQPGASPRADVVRRVAAVLQQISGKRIDVATGEPIAGDARMWTADALRAVADAGAPQDAQRPVLRLLFVDGGFAENDQAVGVAVRGDVATVFADRVAEAAGVLVDPRVVEEAVTIHEVGHLLGLVDLVLDTGRADPDHPGHSPNRGSVMYHAVESTLLGTLLSGGPPRDFDDADLADLAAIRDG